MKYFLGIDGGGSNIRAALVDKEHNLIKHVKMKQNVNPSSRGFDAVIELFTGLSEILSAYIPAIEGVFISLAGVATVQQVTFIEESLKGIFVSAKNIRVLPDAYGALTANLKEKAGMLIICGTGSVAVGKEEGLFFDFGNKGFYRAGGWGYLLGDEGSGFWIVKKVFQAYLRYVDGVGIYDPCFELFERELSKIPREAVACFYDPGQRGKVASLSKALLKMDSLMVWEIVREGTWEFYKKIRSLRKKIDSSADVLCYMGGMFENERYRNLFVNFNECSFILEKGIEKLEFELATIASDYLN
ncbi:MAG TPA: BadF/BadG/BcrA/BcrD ATPase family protein [Thermotogota bacterium]|nr:BadF/BadG/BcrA/BcrD ATPase family protein [Thermotogota bacterium]